MFNFVRRSQPELRLEITIVVEPDDGGFHSFCLALRGLHAMGETKEEALRNAADLVPVYLTSLAKHGDPLPVGEYCTVHHEPSTFAFIPAATTRNVTVQWPTMQMSGIS